MSQGAGTGKTPGRVVELLRAAVAESSQSALARATGVNQAAIGRYLKGVGEPNTATLEKLGAYFGKSVGWLRRTDAEELKEWNRLSELNSEAHFEEYCKDVDNYGDLCGPFFDAIESLPFDEYKKALNLMRLWIDAHIEAASEGEDIRKTIIPRCLIRRDPAGDPEKTSD